MVVHSRGRSLHGGQLEELPLLANDDDDVQAAADGSDEQSADDGDSDEQSAAADDDDDSAVGDGDVMSLPAPTSLPLTRPA